jgi:hypothetical protein
MDNKKEGTDASEGEQEASVGGVEGGLQLTPNEIVGYRIIPDEHNWTVALVRKHGSGKHVGQEYATSLAYCASLEFAAKWIIERDARMKTEMHGLMEAMRLAKGEAVRAVIAVEKGLRDGTLKLPGHSPVVNRDTKAMLDREQTDEQE